MGIVKNLFGKTTVYKKWQDKKIASFKKEQELNEKLLNEGYKSRIIPMYSGKYHAVTINSFAGNTAAYNNLNSIKEKFQDGAWVYKD